MSLISCVCVCVCVCVRMCVSVCVRACMQPLSISAYIDATTQHASNLGAQTSTCTIHPPSPPSVPAIPVTQLLSSRLLHTRVPRP